MPQREPSKEDADMDLLQSLRQYEISKDTIQFADSKISFKFQIVDHKSTTTFAGEAQCEEKNEDRDLDHGLDRKIDS